MKLKDRIKAYRKKILSPPYLTRMGLYVAVGVLLGNGRILSVTLGAHRYSLGNLSLLMAGITLGPVCGAFVGLVADISICFVGVWGIPIPLVTVGAAMVGGVSGLVYRLGTKKRKTSSPSSAMKKRKASTPPLAIGSAVAAGHLVGSVIVKSIGLAQWYGLPLLPTMVGRLAEYAIIGTVEFTIIAALLPRCGKYVWPPD